MKCLETQCKGLQATIVQRAREKNYRSLFALVNSTETESIAREVFQTKISSECKEFAKKKSSINTNDPVLVSDFRNIRFVKEVEENTPYLYSALQGAVKSATNFNQIALRAATCMSTRTKSSAFLLRNSVILQHGGCKGQDMSRLSKLGICSSHSTSIRAQNRMGEGFDDDILEWKHNIETSKKKVLFLEEVKTFKSRFSTKMIWKLKFMSILPRIQFQATSTIRRLFSRNAKSCFLECVKNYVQI